ncbi:MAG TPA: molybdenum cofactor guanylyltransferase [Gemmatimonadales bacterium]|nr:molybdenum cofactor guanylyltransferase [Gemmatimonadales bacterium]
MFPQRRVSEPRPVRGAILAGGGATRFGGTPKGLEQVGGRRVIDRLVDAFVDGLGEAPLLVANAPEASTWCPGIRVVRDLIPGAGSLGGLYTAVEEAPAPVVCVAWDMPFVPPGLIATLAEAVGDADVVLPASAGRRGVEPLCGAYGHGSAAPMHERIVAGDFRAIAFHESVRVSILSMDSIRRFGDPAVLFFNVNTPEDLIKADRLWQQRASSR